MAMCISLFSTNLPSYPGTTVILVIYYYTGYDKKDSYCLELVTFPIEKREGTIMQTEKDK